MGRTHILAVSILLPVACGGIATVDLFFSAAPPRQDGSTNIAVRVTEGTGTSLMVLEERVEPFDEGFDVASIRLPFGGNRTVVADIETNETPPRVIFSGRSVPFRLEESDSPLLTIFMAPPPEPGSAREVGATNGRVATSTVTFAIALGNALGVVISEDPFFAGDRTDRFNPGDMRLVPTTFAPLVVNVAFAIDGRCSERAGCPRTVYFKSLDGGGMESAVYSTSFIYDPLPPRLLDASVRIEEGAVLGGSRTAEVITVFDEPVVLSVFASLTGGSPECPNQVEVIDGLIGGLDFPVDCAGTYSIEIAAADLAANAIRLFEVATLVVDRSMPPPVELNAVTSSCAMAQPIIVGGVGAAETRAVVVADDTRARADAQGRFVVGADPGMVSLFQLDSAGNQSAPRNVEVMPCE